MGTTQAVYKRMSNSTRERNSHKEWDIDDRNPDPQRFERSQQLAMQRPKRIDASAVMLAQTRGEGPSVQTVPPSQLS